MRLYFHPGGRVMPQGIVCTECGVTLDENLRAPVPCRVPTASAAPAGGLLWFIHVANCRAQLLAQDAAGRYFIYHCDDELELKIRDRIRQAVNEQGSITRSGMYSVPDDLLALISEAVDAGRLKVVAQ